MKICLFIFSTLIPYRIFCFKAKLKPYLVAKMTIIPTVVANKAGHVIYFGEDSISSM